MRLPNADRAEIDPAKLREYLLSREHPLGRFKARFFGALGFSAEQWEELASALRAQHLAHQDAAPGASAAYGQSFTIRAILKGPTGESAMVVSVWFIPSGKTVPRFVTAYPGAGQ